MKPLTDAEIATMRAIAIGRGARDFWAMAHEVADLFGVTVTEITSKDRRDHVSLARHFVCLYALRRGFSKRRIGIFLGRDRSTILHSIARAEAYEKAAKTEEIR